MKSPNAMIAAQITVTSIVFSYADGVAGQTVSSGSSTADIGRRAV